MTFEDRIAEITGMRHSAQKLGELAEWLSTAVGVMDGLSGDIFDTTEKRRARLHAEKIRIAAASLLRLLEAKPDCVKEAMGILQPRDAADHFMKDLKHLARYQPSLFEIANIHKLRRDMVVFCGDWWRSETGRNPTPGNDDDAEDAPFLRFVRLCQAQFDFFGPEYDPDNPEHRGDPGLLAFPLMPRTVRRALKSAPLKDNS